jgi:hypothetical protein
MAYTILNTDGSTLLLLADGTVDQNTTSLDLVGRNVNGYGQYFNNNFIKLLANSANSTDNPPKSPLVGQLWYDTSIDRLKIYSSNQGFATVSGAIVAAQRPTSLINGDLWWDDTNAQLKIYADNTTTVVGPTFPKAIGDTGWVYPNPSIKNPFGAAQNAILLKNYGNVQGILSNSQFNLSNTDSQTYFSTSTTSTVVAGLTLVGDLSVHGSVYTKHLYAYFDLNLIGSGPGTGPDPTNYFYYQSQNNTIISMLELLYPPNKNTSLDEPGLIIGSELRASCAYAGSNDNAGPNGTQFRRFRVVSTQSNVLSWQAYEIYPWSFLDDGFGNPATINSNIISEIPHG